MAQITEVPPPGKRKSPTRELIESVVLALLVALAIRVWVAETYRVEGSSMEHTLRDGERVLVAKFVYKWVRKPERGDIVVFLYPKDPEKAFIKRVVGLPGDRVEVKGGKVLVNGQVMEEVSTAIPAEMDSPVETVPDGSVWVLGDNRNNSEDSRFFGEVPYDLIRGPAFIRIWPLYRVTLFHNPVPPAGRR